MKLKIPSSPIISLLLPPLLPPLLLNVTTTLLPQSLHCQSCRPPLSALEEPPPLPPPSFPLLQTLHSLLALLRHLLRHPPSPLSFAPSAHLLCSSHSRSTPFPPTSATTMPTSPPMVTHSPMAVMPSRSTPLTPTPLSTPSAATPSTPLARTPSLHSFDANIASTSFSFYVAASFGVAGSFSSCTATTNSPDLRFSS